MHLIPAPLSALLHSHQRFCDSLKNMVHACCPSTRAARSNIILWQNEAIQFNGNVEVKQSKFVAYNLREPCMLPQTIAMMTLCSITSLALGLNS